MQKTLIALAALMLCASCSGFIDSMDEKPELTSPCAGIDGSPCGPKRPVNLWLYPPAEQMPS